MSGDWTLHPTYGRQFNVESFAIIPPVTKEGIERYLGSGLIKGIGPVTAKKIVKKFGLKTLKVIEEEPERLIEIEGIGPQKAAKITKALEEQKHVRRVMVFLRGLGSRPRWPRRISPLWEAATVIRKTLIGWPMSYLGSGFVPRTGWRDYWDGRIQRTPNGSGRHPYFLHKYTEEGHVFPKRNLSPRSPRSWKSRRKWLAGELPVWWGKRVYLDEDRLYLSFFYWSERKTAERLRTLLGAYQEKTLPFPRPSMPEFATLTVEQRLAVEKALTDGVLIITGGPGTGKTTTVRSIIRLLQLKGEKVLMAAPTGRAAKRLTEATGVEAKTIHRLLEFGYTVGMGLTYGRDEEIPGGRCRDHR